MPFLIIAFFGRDDHHAVRAARSVYSSCGSVFQHVYTRHIIHVNHIQRYVGRHSVYDDQRLRVIDTAHTADIQTDIATRCTRSCYLQTRGATLQSSSYRRSRGLLQVFVVHLRNSAGQVAFLLNAVAYYHYLFQHLGVLFENNMHLGRSRQRLRGVSHITDHQGRTFRHLKTKITVKIGYRTIACALFQHTGTDNRFSVYIHNSSRHLRIQRKRTGEKETE